MLKDSYNIHMTGRGYKKLRVFKDPELLLSKN